MVTLLFILLSGRGSHQNGKPVQRVNTMVIVYGHRKSQINSCMLAPALDQHLGEPLRFPKFCNFDLR